ncbi:DUF305 domain-containing protein [Nocardia sp. NBC_01388]|uniref:DUF305 domain-containing protein n=1 Tax=Nocardia sp. NBC_01388 TaxID=2903596 RepID=UPI00325042FB
MNHRNGILVAAFLCLAPLLVVLGVAARPVLIEDPRAPILNSVEIGFAQDMLAHHSQALIMVARLDPGVDPTIRALAQRIDAAQRGEIGELTGWLRLSGATTINPDPMAWMRHDAMADHQHGAAATETTGTGVMPGMATQVELDALTAARGPAAGELFLRMMERHHYGGIQMARAADALLESGVVKQTARDMMSTEGQEAGVMGLMLTSLSALR